MKSSTSSDALANNTHQKPFTLLSSLKSNNKELSFKSNLNKTQPDKTDGKLPLAKSPFSSFGKKEEKTGESGNKPGFNFKSPALSSAKPGLFGKTENKTEAKTDEKTQPPTGKLSIPLKPSTSGNLSTSSTSGTNTPSTGKPLTSTSLSKPSAPSSLTSATGTKPILTGKTSTTLSKPSAPSSLSSSTGTKAAPAKPLSKKEQLIHKLVQLDIKLDAKMEQYDKWEEQLIKEENEINEKERQFEALSQEVYKFLKDKEIEEENDLREAEQKTLELQNILLRYPQQEPSDDNQKDLKIFSEMLSGINELVVKIQKRGESYESIYELYNEMINELGPN